MNELEHLIHQRRAITKDEIIARAICKDASSVSRIFSGDTGVRLADLSSLLTELGLKVVNSEDLVITPGELDAVETLALKYLETKRGGK